MIQLTQTNRWRFDELAGQGLKDYNYVVSIVCPTDNMTQLGDWHNIYKMWDVPYDLKNKVREYRAPSKEDCNRILTDFYGFLQKNKNTDMQVLVHCDAGVSRSPAVALGLLWYISSMFFTPDAIHSMDSTMFKWYINERKQFCLRLLSPAPENNGIRGYVLGKPSACPNPAMIRHYRSLLKYFPW